MRKARTSDAVFPEPLPLVCLFASVADKETAATIGTFLSTSSPTFLAATRVAGSLTLCFNKTVAAASSRARAAATQSSRNFNFSLGSSLTSVKLITLTTSSAPGFGPGNLFPPRWLSGTEPTSPDLKNEWYQPGQSCRVRSILANETTAVFASTGEELVFATMSLIQNSSAKRVMVPGKWNRTLLQIE